MFQTVRTRMVSAAAIAAMGIAGCAQKSDSPQETYIDSPPPPTITSSHEHAHPSEGPHHGDLIELGNEEYHAELVHDESSVTIYLLDSSAKAPLAIEASELTINLKHDGKPEQFKLAAQRQESDPEGKSSRFVSNDKELAAHIEETETEPKLVVTIDGKSFTGTITHSHDHGDHSHGDHKHE